MAKTHAKLSELDPVWERITQEARDTVADEPLMGGLVHSSILHHKTIESALAYRISLKLASSEMPEQIVREICDWAYTSDPELALAARIGKGIMIDHAHSIVIGETAVVGDNVSMLHSVTLGGTGKEEEDRHPKIGDGVLIGAGAKVLGNIKVGHCSRIAAGSVVLEEVPPCKTVAGVPARIVGEAGCDQPSVAMDQLLGVR